MVARIFTKINQINIYQINLISSLSKRLLYLRGSVVDLNPEFQFNPDTDPKPAF
jgi:hypothetical protein